MNDVYELIGKLLAAFVVGLLAYLAPKLKDWLETNTSQATQDILQEVIRAFVRAAEQLYHDTDPDGTRRNQFVREQLAALGYEVTEAVLNMIEGAVWEINTETKKAQVQTKKLASVIKADRGEIITQEALARMEVVSHRKEYGHE